MPAFETLSFSDSVTICGLSAKRLPKFKSLRMSYNAAEEPLASVELEGLPALSCLNLPGKPQSARLTDECFEHIDTFLSLVAVDISNSCITDRTVERLLRLPLLESVDIRGTDTTEAAAERLRQHGAPGVRVRQIGRR